MLQAQRPQTTHPPELLGGDSRAPPAGSGRAGDPRLRGRDPRLPSLPEHGHLRARHSLESLPLANGEELAGSAR
eukprot:4630426-Pyramimonas_sp.AAC.1